MNIEAARNVLLVRAAEDSGGLISTADRRLAEENLARPDPPDEKAGDAFTTEEIDYLAARAASLRRSPLEKRFPALRKVLLPGGAWRLAIMLLPVIALGLGLAANKLAPAGRINILSIPILGVVAWNAAIYLWRIGSFILNRSRGKANSAGGLAGALGRWIEPMRESRVAAWMKKVDPAGADSGFKDALGVFARRWGRLILPVRVRQGQALLDFCAALLAVGMIGGMYFRGVAREYRAGWESTFLDARQVRWVTGAVLGPASKMSGIPLPGDDRLKELNFNTGAKGENAAPWIHLYGWTLLLYVFAPRVLLAVAGWSGAAARARSLKIGDRGTHYFSRILSADRGATTIATVIPYGYEPDPADRERLRAALHDLWGGAAGIDFRPAVAYGAEDTALEELGGGNAGDHLVLAMNFGSTPEDENHGLMAAGMRDLAAREGPPDDLLVVLDGGRFIERFGGMKGRVDERRKAWAELLSRTGIGFAVLGTEEKTSPEGEMRKALWRADT